MFVKAIRHSGIIIKDIDKALDFYCNFLGFKEINRGFLEYDECEKVLGFEFGRLTWIKLQAIEGQLLELYLFDDYDNDVCNSGLSHISFTVENIDNLCKQMKEKELQVLSKPTLDKSKKHKVFFGLDPDGNLIEFVELQK